ncbi:hypothetical protein G5714_004283 [Onychostoma macrolepis]|uniref:Uncharacterized protein n=1 Tax=Onychostoma macrolepis TaxID=369639 RepID=A0A7J6D4A7_9TELE|nr:hypothetical protein G5714_004283 [Onychostoma macrolepis]
MDVPQSTPVKTSNIEQSEGTDTGLLLTLLSPEPAASKTHLSTSGTYIALPPVRSCQSDKPAQSPTQSEENDLDISMLSLECPSDKDTSFSNFCGRERSPGFSAKYNTYSLMDDDSDKIVHFELVQVTEASSSVAMEPIVLKRSLSKILEKGIKVDVLTTDRSPSTRKIMRVDYPFVQHEFDIWHVAKGLLKDLRQMSLFKHTGTLEVFHSVLLKYCQKNVHFHYSSMLARTQLAILDHNENVHHKQATTSGGAPWYNIVFPKHSKEWVARKLFEPTTQTFRDDLVRKVLERRMDPQIVFKERSSHVTAPSLPANIALKPKPDKEEAILKHQSRFSK